MNRRTHKLGTLVAVLATAMFGAVGVAQASVGGFSANDGTEGSPSACSTTLDWSCLGAGQVMTILDPSGTADVAFASGTEDNPDSWKFGPSSSLAAKDDIQANWSYAFADSSFAKNYLALAFKRVGGTGNSVVNFELGQNAPGDTYVNSNGTPVFCRANGDVRIAFDVQSTSQASTTVPKILTWKWSGAPCAAGSSGTWNQVTTLPAGAAEGRLNPSTITNYLSTAAEGSSFVAGTFGEAAADLTGLADVIKPAAGCEFFNHLQVTTSSSTSPSSAAVDYIEGGQIVAPACENTPPPPPPGCNAPTVQITSPVDNSTDDTSTVTLSGTSTNLGSDRVAVYDGATAVGDPTADANSGNWTLTLSNVSNGDHTYTAKVQTGCGSALAEVHVTVFAGTGNSGTGGSGNSGSGSSSVSGASTGSNGNGNASVNGLWLACTNPRTLSIADVYAWAGKARVTGFAPLGSVGKVVTIVAAWNHKVLGTATVLGDNSFRAIVALPPTGLRSNLKRGAYMAQLGTQTSAPLAFARRMYNTRIQIRFVKERVTSYKWRTIGGKRKLVKVFKYISAETVTFVGTVVGPLTSPRQSVIIRGAPTCAGVAHGPVLARAKVNSRGRFSVTFQLPKSLLRYRVLFLRAQTVGLQVPKGRHAKASRPKRQALYGITRGVHVFGAA